MTQEQLAKQLREFFFWQTKGYESKVKDLVLNYAHLFTPDYVNLIIRLNDTEPDTDLHYARYTLAYDNLVYNNAFKLPDL